MYYILMVLYIVSCFVLIMFVLLQPGKSDAAAVFGGGANSAAFGPRGTQTVLAKITITAAVIFFLTAFVFSIPGLFEERSIGERQPADSGAQQAPIPAPPVTPQPGTAPATPVPPPAANSNTDAGAAKKDDIARPAGAKNSNAAKANANK